MRIIAFESPLQTRSSLIGGGGAYIEDASALPDFSKSQNLEYWQYGTG